MKIAACRWLCAVVSLLPLCAYSAWPEKPVKLVVPYSAGGTADAVARLVAAELGTRLKQQFIIDNRAGAGGTIGAQIAAQAPADGYTFLYDATAFSVNPSLYPKLGFSYAKDFAPVALVARIPSLLVVPVSSPVHSVSELVNEARRRPGALSYGSAGTGGAAHLSAELFKQGFGLSMVHVSYKGGAPALTDLVGGQIDFMFSAITSSGPLVTSGKLRALATAFDRRVEALPKVPTIAESGLPGFSAYEWNAMFAPAATPPQIVQRLELEMREILTAASMKERFAAQGAIPAQGTAKDLSAFVQAESAKWAGVIKSAGITAE